jgi:hypothetical protein
LSNKIISDEKRPTVTTFIPKKTGGNKSYLKKYNYEFPHKKTIAN